MLGENRSTPSLSLRNFNFKRSTPRPASLRHTFAAECIQILPLELQKFTGKVYQNVMHFSMVHNTLHYRVAKVQNSASLSLKGGRPGNGERGEPGIEVAESPEIPPRPTLPKKDTEGDTGLRQSVGLQICL